MTEKRCTDCKHTKGIGYDFWCGEGHTEYEVFIGETNCPYFEYHDWSKGTPSRTEKRFTDDGIEEIENQSFTDNLTGKTYWIDKGLDEIVDLLNALNDENEQLKQDVEYWKQVASQYSNELNVFEHCKKYKTECKDIYWSSD